MKEGPRGRRMKEGPGLWYSATTRSLRGTAAEGRLNFDVERCKDGVKDVKMGSGLRYSATTPSLQGAAGDDHLSRGCT